MNRFKFRGEFKLEHFRNGKKIGECIAHNDVVNEGLDKILDIMFHGTTPISPWHVGLIDNDGFTSLSNSDTLASHAGWTEYTDYDGNRKEWTEDAASSQSITNTTVVTFDIDTDSQTIYGIFLCSVASGTTGTLWATAPLSGGTLAVNDGDQVKLTYTVTAARA